MNPTSRIYWQAIFYREAFQKSLGLPEWGEANSPRWKKWRQQPDPHALKGCRSFPSCLRQRVCAQKTTISQAFHFGPSGKKSLKHTHTHVFTKSEHLYIADGNAMVKPLWKPLWWFLRELIIEILCGPEIPLLGLYPHPKKKQVHKYIHVYLIHSSAMHNIHYRVIKRNEVLIYETPWTNLQNTMASERSQILKVIYCMIPFVHKILEIDKSIETEFRLVVSRAWETANRNKLNK